MTIVVGNTYIFRLAATKDGAVWDLTGATVTMALVTPTGIASNKTASVTSAVGGIAEYNSVVGDITIAGIWTRSWQVTQGAVVQESPVVTFAVSPGLI